MNLFFSCLSGCPNAYISFWMGEEEHDFFFLTLLTLPIARPIAQIYCLHLGNPPPLHLGHPHFHSHFPGASLLRRYQQMQRSISSMGQNIFLPLPPLFFFFRAHANLLCSPGGLPILLFFFFPYSVYTGLCKHIAVLRILGKNHPRDGEIRTDLQSDVGLTAELRHQTHYLHYLSSSPVTLSFVFDF